MVAWEPSYHKLLAFYKEHGHLDVPFPATDSSHQDLHKWLLNQKRNRCKLSQDRLERLNKLGIFSQPNCAQLEEKWQDMYERIVRYKEEHNGECHVPRYYAQDKALGFWCGNQRMLYKQQKLRPDRLKKLQDLGFPICPDERFAWTDHRNRNHVDSHWRNMFVVLLQFQQQHGHLLVPTLYEHEPGGILLGRWVRRQRTQLAQGKLPQDRRRKLDAIGFVWKKPNKHEKDTNNPDVQHNANAEVYEDEPDEFNKNNSNVSSNEKKVDKKKKSSGDEEQPPSQAHEQAEASNVAQDAQTQFSQAAAAAAAPNSLSFSSSSPSFSRSVAGKKRQIPPEEKNNRKKKKNSKQEPLVPSLLLVQQRHQISVAVFAAAPAVGGGASSADVTGAAPSAPLVVAATASTATALPPPPPKTLTTTITTPAPVLQAAAAGTATITGSIFSYTGLKECVRAVVRSITSPPSAPSHRQLLAPKSTTTTLPPPSLTTLTPSLVVAPKKIDRKDNQWMSGSSLSVSPPPNRISAAAAATTNDSHVCTSSISANQIGSMDPLSILADVSSLQVKAYCPGIRR